MKKTTKTLIVFSALILPICTFVSLSNEYLTAFEARKNTPTRDLDVKEVSITFDDAEYKYVVPQSANFFNEPLEGKAYLSQGKIILTFNETTLTIPNFDFYRLLDAQDDFMFYQADVIDDTKQNGEYAYVALLPNRNSTYELNVHYGVEEIRTLYLINAPVTEAIVNFIDEKAQNYHIGNDEISDKLRASSRAHTQGINKSHLNDTENNSSRATRAIQTIKEYAYDSYTNSDKYLDEYAKKTKLNLTENSKGYIIDDPIVQIVPKELFFIKGEHFYIGKEYGFVVKVKEEMFLGVSYRADVLVFDIENEAPSFPSNPTGVCRITPKFNWIYQIREESYSDWYDYDPSLTQIVTVPLDYNDAEIFLDDIGIKVSLENPDALNQGDPGYVASEDNGAFIIQTRVNSKGVGLKKNNNSFLEDTIYFSFGFIPYVSDALNVYQYIANLNHGFGDNGYIGTREESLLDNEVNISTYETNNTDQIAKHGCLIKSKAVTIKSNSNSPRFINVGGYAEIKYVTARKSGSNYNKVRVITSVSANALEDQTLPWWDFGWLAQGDISNYGRVTGTYVTSAYGE